MPTLESLDAAMLVADRSVAALPRLGGGQIAATGRQLFRTAGTDAAVYQLRQANGRALALRVPYTDTLNPTIVDAWRRIGTDPALAPLRQGKGALLIPDTQFVPDAMSVPGPDSRLKRYPLMAMTWVMAPTLLTTVVRAAAASDGAYIGQLAAAWATTVERLRAVSFAHGDLTGDNILVRPGIEIALVDYDTAEWSSHAAGPQTRATPGYAHPRADAGVSATARDPFTSLLIYASLRVLAEHPELRASHGGDPAKPNSALLFSAWDLRNPGNSELVGQVRQLTREPQTRWLLDQLIAACAAAPGDIPALPDLLRPRSAAPGIAATPARPAPPVRPVATPPPAPGNTTRPSTWAGIATPTPPPPARTVTPSPEAAVPARPVPPARQRPSEPDRVETPTPTTNPGSLARGGSQPPNGPLAPTRRTPAPVDRVRSTPSQDLIRSADREQLKRLLARGDAAAVLAHWREHRLADDETARAQYGDRIRELEREAAVGEAQRAAQRNDTVQFLRLWHQHDLASSPSAKRLQPIADVARRRSDAADRVRRALASRDVATVARYWPSLKGDSLVGDLSIQARGGLHVLIGDQIG